MIIVKKNKDYNARGHAREQVIIPKLFSKNTDNTFLLLSWTNTINFRSLLLCLKSYDFSGDQPQRIRVTPLKTQLTCKAR